jgi:hypothetical protein
MTHEDPPNVVLGAGRMKRFCPFVMMHCSSHPANNNNNNKNQLVSKDDLAYHIAFIL